MGQSNNGLLVVF